MWRRGGPTTLRQCAHQRRRPAARLPAAGFASWRAQGGAAFAHPGANGASASGFTLLEMIVVLAILGLATALVVPAMVRGIDSWRRQAAMDAVLDQIRALPGSARGTGRTIIIDDTALQGSRPPLRAPGEWTLGAPTKWQVNANGVCEGGEVTVGNPQGERRIRVSAPFCEPVIE